MRIGVRDRLFNKIKVLRGGIIIAALAVGCLAGWFAGLKHFESEYTRPIGRIVRGGGHRLTNRLLACEDANGVSNIRQEQALKEKIDGFITSVKASGKISEISLLWRDLVLGNTIEVEAGNVFEPASLSKVPLMLAYLKQAERDPSVLQKKLTYHGREDLTEDQFFAPKQKIEPGKSYTIQELIRFMMEFSDNNAWKLLYDNMNKDSLDRVHQDLGISYSTGASGEDLINVRYYSLFFRVLYNCTYLNEEMSEKALDFMTERDFDFGVAKAVPPFVPVASKFGETGEFSPQGNRLQLHDFAIVYYPGRPYFLAIMTKGSDYGAMGRAIMGLSDLIFRQHDSENGRILQPRAN